MMMSKRWSRGVGHFLETKNEKLIDEEKINKLPEGEGHRKMNR